MYVFFFSAVLCGDRTGAVGHLVGLAWTQFWEHHTAAYHSGWKPSARVECLFAEILSVMTWGAAAWLDTWGQMSSA